MQSNINPSQIDGNFPIAGQDNDTQGFRDNFTNIRTNFSFAKLELEDLQNKVLLKSPLTGQQLNNDLNNAVLFRPQLKSATQTFRDWSYQSGVHELSWLNGSFQKVILEGSVTIGLVEFPSSGVSATMRLWVTVNNVAHTLTFPNSVIYGVNKIDGFDSTNNRLTFTATGDYLFDLITVDGGSEFWIIQVA